MRVDISESFKNSKKKKKSLFGRNYEPRQASVSDFERNTAINPEDASGNFDTAKYQEYKSNYEEFSASQG